MSSVYIFTMEQQKERKIHLLQHMMCQSKVMHQHFHSNARCLKINMDDWIEKMVLEYKEDQRVDGQDLPAETLFKQIMLQHAMLDIQNHYFKNQLNYYAELLLDMATAIDPDHGMIW